MDTNGIVELGIPKAGEELDEPIQAALMENEATGEVEVVAEVEEADYTIKNPKKKHIERVPILSPVEGLLLKLEQWLLLQPEWAIILAAPRATRRKAISLLAKRILTIPQRYH